MHERATAAPVQYCYICIHTNIDISTKLYMYLLLHQPTSYTNAVNYKKSNCWTQSEKRKKKNNMQNVIFNENAHIAFNSIFWI